MIVVSSKTFLRNRLRFMPLLISAGCFLSSTSCSSNRTVASKTPATPKPARIGSKQQGIASWYGEPYHGRQAANGEIYNMDALTAAHKTLPFETWVRVKNLSNKKTTEVRITDRGPFVAGRIIDLSRASAREIELVGPGTARVRLEVIKPPKQFAQHTFAQHTFPQQTMFSVQIAAVTDRGLANQIAKQAESFGETSVFEKPGSRPTVFRVLVGKEQEPKATALLRRIRKYYKDAFLIKL